MDEATPTTAGPDLERPTWVRWRIVALLFAFSFMSWFNRISIQAAGDIRIREEYGISETSYGTISTAFFIVYTLAMTPGGWFIDRFGAWRALVLMGFGSALFVALTGLPGLMITDAFLLLLCLQAIRGLMGACSAPIYPASGRVVFSWIPVPRRALTNGLITSAAVLGNTSTYVVFGFLIDTWNWPTAFFLTGAVTALLAVAWTWYATAAPAQHAVVNAAERKLIGEHDIPGSPAAAPAGTWLRLLRNRSLVLLTLSYAAVGYFEYASFFWMPTYIKTVGGLQDQEWRWSVSVVYLAMALGMPLGGLLADRLQHKLGYRVGRAAVAGGGMATSAVLLGCVLLAREPAWIVFWFALAMAAHGTCEGPSWTTAVELGGRRGGTSAGIFNTGGNVLGSLAPTVTPFIAALAGWRGGLGVAGVICLAGAILWFWIDPAARVADGDPRHTTPSGA
jgi:MFS family permease